MKALDARYLEIGSLPPLEGPLATLQKRLMKIQPSPGAKVTVVGDEDSGLLISLAAWRALTPKEMTELKAFLEGPDLDLDGYSRPMRQLIQK